MKRYLLFAGQDQYPTGGWGDFKGDFDTIEDAYQSNKGTIDWWEIVDSETGQVIKDIPGMETQAPIRKMTPKQA